MSKIKEIEKMSGFIRHTQVLMADKTLKRIDEIQVGDLVLSKPENDLNGELTCKKVTRIFKSPNKEKIMSPVEGVFCTDTPTIMSKYIDTYVWEEASNLTYSFELYCLFPPKCSDILWPRYGKKTHTCEGGSYLLALEGNLALLAIFGGDNESASEMPKVFVDFSDSQPKYIDICYGESTKEATQRNQLLDYRMIGEDSPVRDYYIALQDKYDYYDYETEPQAYRDNVYNLEVEDFHTYFISEYGIWLRDQTFNNTN